MTYAPEISTSGYIFAGTLENVVWRNRLSAPAERSGSNRAQGTKTKRVRPTKFSA